MAIGRMNEIWSKLALPLFLYVLLLQGSRVLMQTTVTPGTSSSSSSSHASLTDSVTQNANSNTPAISSTSGSAANEANPATVLNDSNVGQTASSTVRTSTGFHGKEETTKPIPTQPMNPESPVSTKTFETTSLQKSTKEPITTTSVKNGLLQEEEISTKSQNPNNQYEHSEEPKSNVFAAVLGTGLTGCAALIVGYVLRKHCHLKGKGMKLAESSITDEENQGNTLMSVAPLNPPENPEKPSQNGESLEAVKPQNPPAATNGHSATKADTEF